MRNSPKVVSIERVAHKRRLVLSVPLPSFQLPDRLRELNASYLLSMMLFIGGLGGVGYSLAPALFTPTPTVSSLDATTSPLSAKDVSILARSVPVRLEIPSIGLSTDLIELGKNEDGSMETPVGYDQAGWYKYSPTPGEIGPAIITGHVDSYQGPAVFFYLKDLQAGERVHVDRQDGSRATFRIDKVAIFDQAAFPTAEVYGNIDHAGLRLITCSGAYNPLTNSYSHNAVVYASYVPDEKPGKT